MKQLIKSYNTFFDIVELVGLTMDEYALHGMATINMEQMHLYSFPDDHHERNFRHFVETVKSSTFPKSVESSKIPAARKKSFEKLLS